MKLFFSKKFVNYSVRDYLTQIQSDSFPYDRDIYKYLRRLEENKVNILTSKKQLILCEKLLKKSIFPDENDDNNEKSPEIDEKYKDINFLYYLIILQETLAMIALIRSNPTAKKHSHYHSTIIQNSAKIDSILLEKNPFPDTQEYNFLLEVYEKDKNEYRDFPYIDS